MSLPRGVRLNNPGNIRRSGSPWLGKVTPSADAEFEQFDTPEHGIRALAKLILTYYRNHGLHTIRQVVGRFVPPSENATEPYIQAVAGRLSLGPSDSINPTDAGTLAALVKEIIRQEQGIAPFSAAQVDRAVGMALQS